MIQVEVRVEVIQVHKVEMVMRFGQDVRDLGWRRACPSATPRDTKRGSMKARFESPSSEGRRLRGGSEEGRVLMEDIPRGYLKGFLCICVASVVRGGTTLVASVLQTLFDVPSLFYACLRFFLCL